MSAPPTAADRSAIAALADQCVMCGLCLPHCPTYRVGRTEAESPRGRIAFAKALASGNPAPGPALVEHLDQCLACMSCERACPSGVRYGELLVRTRALLRETGERRAPRWSNPSLLRAGLRAARIPGVRAFARSAFGRALLRPFGLERAAREMPVVRAAPSIIVDATRVTRGRVGLFLGCAAQIVERDVHAAAARILAALGYEVVLPKTACCCGALALHAGESDRAAAQASGARAAFDGVDTILASASGCFGALRDAFTGTPTRVRDLHEFIANDAQLSTLRFAALDRRAALHTPCTQANVARTGDAIARLLRLVPQLDVVPLPVDPRCCGAAGSYFLEHPAIADALRGEKLDQTAAVAPDLLITSNVGCRIFLDNGLRERSSNVAVVHPVVLLADRLQN